MEYMQSGLPTLVNMVGSYVPLEAHITGVYGDGSLKSAIVGKGVDRFSIDNSEGSTQWQFYQAADRVHFITAV